jgi:hypothetical protein
LTRPRLINADVKELKPPVRIGVGFRSHLLLQHQIAEKTKVHVIGFAVLVSFVVFGGTSEV